ncbi:MAG: hypothetical protein ACON4H_15780 [Rubripirellula sp.]
METFSFFLASTPLLIHMLLVSAIRLSGRYYVTTRGREIISLAFAVSGMIAIGPVELFFPMAAAAVFGPLVWAVLVLFYSLCTALLVLGAKPRLVVYGGEPRDLLEPLLMAARSVDSDATAVESQLQIFLPQHGVHLKVSGQRSSDYSNVVAFEDNLSIEFWSVLRAALREQLRGRVVSRRRGVLLGLATIIFAGFLIFQIFQSGDQLTDGIQDWIWR